MLVVILKKCKELKDLGISIGVAYSSRKGNGLFVFGDGRITSVIEAYKDEILLNPEWMEVESDRHSGQQHIILPPLPGPISELNGLTLKALIMGVIQDQNLSFSSTRPLWC